MNGKKLLLTAGGLLTAAAAAEVASLGWKYGFGPMKRLRDIRRAHSAGNGEEYDFSHIQRLHESPIDGNTVLFLGSSVMRGEAAQDCSLPEYFAARTGCRVIKETLSGTTLVDSGPNSYVQRLRNNVPKDAKVDLLICQLSTNDASQRKPLGEIGDAPYDTVTVTGAMEEIISYARDTWGCPVAFFTGSHYGDPRYDAMVKRLCELSEKWGLGVLDLWSGEDFNGISPKQRKLYMDDPIHPTKAGYRDWWCPELERQLFDWLKGANA